eukprot:1878223-Alexandrium_andersonii.AAC.1
MPPAGLGAARAKTPRRQRLSWRGSRPARPNTRPISARLAPRPSAGEVGLGTKRARADAAAGWSWRKSCQNQP